MVFRQFKLIICMKNLKWSITWDSEWFNNFYNLSSKGLVTCVSLSIVSLKNHDIRSYLNLPSLNACIIVRGF